MTWPLKWMPAYSVGGSFNPIGIVIHCTESDNGPGSAEAVAGPGWFGGPAAGTSAHKIVDRDSIIEGVRRNTVAWHVGPAGNGYYVGYEFCGRASWTVAQWNAPEQLAMISGAAPYIAADLKAMGAPARWLSLTQAAQKQKGLLSHNDVRLALGGTTHSDPGPNFPYGFLLSEVNKSMGNNPSVDPASGSYPPRLTWNLSGKNYYGNIGGPNESHGGATADERKFVKNIQQWLIRHGVAKNHYSWTWETSTWASGYWGPETDAAMALWHERFYPNQQAPKQCWSDDYDRLAKPVV